MEVVWDGVVEQMIAVVVARVAEAAYKGAAVACTAEAGEKRTLPVAGL